MTQDTVTSLIPVDIQHIVNRDTAHGVANWAGEDVPVIDKSAVLPIKHASDRSVVMDLPDRPAHSLYAMDLRLVRMAERARRQTDVCVEQALVERSAQIITNVSYRQTTVSIHVPTPMDPLHVHVNRATD